MNKQTEEDTFNKLRRPTFKELRIIIRDSNASIRSVCESNYWTLEEYVNETSKIFNIKFHRDILKQCQ